MPGKAHRANLLTALQPWHEVDEGIHRRILQLVDAKPEQDVLWIGCGFGRAVLWWANRLNARVHGVDPDPVAIERADAAARELGLASRVTLQVGDPEDLPHESQAFDLVVIHMLYLPGADAMKVVREASRVVRGYGVVAGIVPTWLSRPSVPEAERLGLLGIHPLLLVEWKQLFREAALVELVAEDAALDGSWISQQWPLVVIRAWRTGGWSAVRACLSRPVFTLARLARRRVLGLSILKGTRWPHPQQ
jgi:SAM-dependent methyltransferase